MLFLRKLFWDALLVSSFISGAIFGSSVDGDEVKIFVGLAASAFLFIMSAMKRWDLYVSYEMDYDLYENWEDDNEENDT